MQMDFVAAQERMKWLIKQHQAINKQAIDTSSDDDSQYEMNVEEKTTSVTTQTFEMFYGFNGFNCSLPFDALNTIFSFLKFKERLNCLQVCKSWSIHTDLFMRTLYFNTFKTYKPSETAYKQGYHHIMTRPQTLTHALPVPFSPKSIADCNYLFFLLLENNQLLEISNLKNSKEIHCRNLMTNEVIYSHTMKAPIFDLKLEKTKLFAIDEEKRFIFVDLQKPETFNLPPHLEKIQFLNLKYEEKNCYHLSTDKITVKNEKSEIIDEIFKKDSEIIQIETTPNHIICQRALSYKDGVFAISKKTHKENTLTLFRNMDHATIAAVNGPYVIIKNLSHEVYIWRELDDQFIPHPISKATLHHSAKPPFVTGSRGNAQLHIVPNPPLVKCFEEIILLCYEGEVIMWNIHSGLLIGGVKHDIPDVADFCTNGQQLFIYGKDGKHVLYDNMPSKMLRDFQKTGNQLS